MDIKRKFKMNIIIDGEVDVDDEFTLEDLNKHLLKCTNEIIKENLIESLDIPADIISVSSKYE